MTIRILIADDQQLVRTGFRMILDGVAADIEVVAEATNGREAVELARKHRPDVCLMDIRMPDLDGIEATRALAGPDVVDPLAVVVVTTFDLDEYVYGALQAGARGFLLKDCEPDLLIHAIRAAVNGDALISPGITGRLLSTFAGQNASVAPPPLIDEPTEREEEVLAALAQGLTNAEIGALLSISVTTVKTHVTHLMNKIGARNRVEIAIWAQRTGRAD